MLEKQLFLISFREGWRGAGVKQIVKLASEPVGGRSRVTELPCFHMMQYLIKKLYTLLILVYDGTVADNCHNVLPVSRNCCGKVWLS